MKNPLIAREIRSKTGVLHFRRWRVFTWLPFFKIYIHEICQADKDLHLHNHPWNYMSVCLNGSYIEQNLTSPRKQKMVTPGVFSKAKAGRFHKIQKLLGDKVWTLFITYGKRREWGYLVNGEFVQHEEYRKLKRLGEV